MNKINIPVSEKELKVPTEILEAFKSTNSQTTSKENKDESILNFEISQGSNDEGEESSRIKHKDSPEVNDR